MATAEELQELVQNYPEEVRIADVNKLLVEAVRKNDKRRAQITVEVPDEMVKSLKGLKEDRRDLVLLVRIPAAMRERSRSRIVLPSEKR